jgi:hypothetical protein
MVPGEDRPCERMGRILEQQYPPGFLDRHLEPFHQLGHRDVLQGLGRPALETAAEFFGRRDEMGTTEYPETQASYIATVHFGRQLHLEARLRLEDLRGNNVRITRIGVSCM